MALVFPTSPSIGDLYPPDPGVSGVSQYRYDGAKWNAVLPVVSLGTQNQGAFNDYQWPLTDGTPGKQLTTDGSGNLTWDDTAVPSLQMLSVLEPFNGVQQSFTLVLPGTSTPVAPVPSTNIIVFLGGVPQIPTASYTIFTNTVTFNEAPLAGSTFYAITSVVV